jgi:histidinol phosphatase-like PHP family hydrolase
VPPHDRKPLKAVPNDVHLHRARELGVKTAIDSDAHSVDQLHFMPCGIDQM